MTQPSEVGGFNELTGLDRLFGDERGRGRRRVQRCSPGDVARGVLAPVLALEVQRAGKAVGVRPTPFGDPAADDSNDAADGATPVRTCPLPPSISPVKSAR